MLDAVIAKNSSRELNRIAPEVLAALRLGTYQLLYTRVGDHAQAVVGATASSREALQETCKQLSEQLLKSTAPD